MRRATGAGVAAILSDRRRRRRSPRSLAGRGGLSQLALEDLARRVARQLVVEDDVARDLEAGEVLLDEAAHVVLAESLAVVEHDVRGQALAVALVVDPDDRDLADRLVAVEELLDLLREHVLAAGDDHVVVAAVDEEAPGRVE